MNPALECEARYERAYDEQTASTVVVYRPDGRMTLACTFHRGLCVALTRAVLS